MGGLRPTPHALRVYRNRLRCRKNVLLLPVATSAKNEAACDAGSGGGQVRAWWQTGFGGADFIRRDCPATTLYIASRTGGRRAARAANGFRRRWLYNGCGSANAGDGCSMPDSDCFMAGWAVLWFAGMRVRLRLDVWRCAAGQATCRCRTAHMHSPCMTVGGRLPRLRISPPAPLLCICIAPHSPYTWT